MSTFVVPASCPTETQVIIAKSFDLHQNIQYRLWFVKKKQKETATLMIVQLKYLSVDLFGHRSFSS